MLSLLAVSIYWDLPVLLVVVSLVYAATRHDRWDKIVREAFGWGLRITTFLGGIGLVLYVLAVRTSRERQ
jgi:Na+/phosphate symporter